MAGIRWDTTPQQAWPEMADDYVQAIRAGIHGVCQKWAPRIENWMKANAPWTDRTGNARQGLYSAVEPPSLAQVVDTIELIMAHAVEYGVYLEGYLPDGTPMLRPSDYKIIEPALDRFGPLVWRDIQRLFA